MNRLLPFVFISFTVVSHFASSLLAHKANTNHIFHSRAGAKSIKTDNKRSYEQTSGKIFTTCITITLPNWHNDYPRHRHCRYRLTVASLPAPCSPPAITPMARILQLEQSPDWANHLPGGGGGEAEAEIRRRGSPARRAAIRRAAAPGIVRPSRRRERRGRRPLRHPADFPYRLAEVLYNLPHQSPHHSHTLPLISYNPSSFGFLRATGCVFSPELPLYHATSSSSLLPA
jgi:hypothetical protein